VKVLPRINHRLPLSARGKGFLYSFLLAGFFGDQRQRATSVDTLIFGDLWWHFFVPQNDFIRQRKGNLF
jgi:hypothetical protein